MSSSKNCPSCGTQDALVKFSGKSFEFGPASMKAEIKDLSGEHCNICNENFFNEESSDKVSGFLDFLSRKRNGDFIKKVRKDKLKITQIEAVKNLSGGGHNAFSRYESGETPMPKSLLILMHVLDKNPGIYEDIKNTRICI